MSISTEQEVCVGHCCGVTSESSWSFVWSRVGVAEGVAEARTERAQSRLPPRCSREGRGARDHSGGVSSLVAVRRLSARVVRGAADRAGGRRGRRGGAQSPRNVSCASSKPCRIRSSPQAIPVVFVVLVADSMRSVACREINNDESKWHPGRWFNRVYRYRRRNDRTNITRTRRRCFKI